MSSTRWPIAFGEVDPPTAPAFAKASAVRREEAMAPMPATAAAIRNTEQKIRRHLDGVNADLEFGFVIIELPGCVCCCSRDRRSRCCIFPG